MGLDDMSALLTLIEQNQDEDWCAESFEEGFRTVMSAVDEMAKKCALIMIADYLERHDAPDRTYRQFGNLFMESDVPILRALLGIAEAVRTLESDWVVFSAMHEVDHSSNFFESRDQAERSIRLPPLAEPSLMYTAADLLRRHQFLATPSIMERSLPRTQTIAHDAYLGTMLPHQLPVWERLRIYLAPSKTLSPSRRSFLGSRHHLFVEANCALRCFLLYGHHLPQKWCQAFYSNNVDERLFDEGTRACDGVDDLSVITRFESEPLRTVHSCEQVPIQYDEWHGEEEVSEWDLLRPLYIMRFLQPGSRLSYFGRRLEPGIYRIVRSVLVDGSRHMRRSQG